MGALTGLVVDGTVALEEGPSSEGLHLPENIAPILNSSITSLYVEITVALCGWGWVGWGDLSQHSLLLPAALEPWLSTLPHKAGTQANVGP